MHPSVTAKGQVTIPVEIRRQLGLRPGDKVKFLIHPSGGAVMLPMRPASELRGMLKYDGPPATIEEMDEAIAEGAAESMEDTVDWPRHEHSRPVRHGR